MHFLKYKLSLSLSWCCASNTGLARQCTNYRGGGSLLLKKHTQIKSPAVFIHFWLRKHILAGITQLIKIFTHKKAIRHYRIVVTFAPSDDTAGSLLLHLEMHVDSLICKVEAICQQHPETLPNSLGWRNLNGMMQSENVCSGLKSPSLKLFFDLIGIMFSILTMIYYQCKVKSQKIVCVPWYGVYTHLLTHWITHSHLFS